MSEPDLSTPYFVLPRLYTRADLHDGAEVVLDKKQTHYFVNVMRRRVGDNVRVFNGRDGEYVCTLSDISKNESRLSAGGQIKPQPAKMRALHLIFTPLKKQRMDILIEKAVELGVTDFHPVLSDHSDFRKIKMERLTAQIIEAAEQSEQLHLAHIHPLVSLTDKLKNGCGVAPVKWCYERAENGGVKVFNDQHNAFLIGPAGGFSQAEVAYLSKQDFIETVSLGDKVLRVETAVIVALARVV